MHDEYGGVQLLGNVSWNPLDSDMPLRGRGINPTQVSLRQIQKWRKSCQSAHGKTCQPAPWSLHLNRIRMIDVKKFCIVKPPQNTRYHYVALSYVWGTMDHLKLSNETQDRLMRPGGLSDLFQDIPKTIKDAMHLTAQLGETYLWVDAICIKQDDPLDREVQIENMGSVYACANLTIAGAAGSDANAGLPGLQPNSRSAKQHQAKINGHQLISTRRPYSLSMKHSTWNNRGWVFQEVNLSRRILVFTEDQMFWHCQSAIWCEDTNLEIPPELGHSALDKQHHHTHGKVPIDLRPIKRYFLLISQYSRRQLTDENDSIHAIRGLLNLVFPVYHYGLPQEHFDSAMVWSAFRHCPTSRRNLFPSWSWAGWDLSSTNGEPGLEFDGKSLFGIKSEVVWAHKNLKLDVASQSDSQNSTIRTPDAMEAEEYWKASLRVVEQKPTHPSPTIMQLPCQHLLCFYTTSAMLSVDRVPFTAAAHGTSRCFKVRAPDPGTFSLVGPSKSRRLVTMLFIDAEWRAQQPDELEFIVIARNTFGFKLQFERTAPMLKEFWPPGQAGLYVMLVERKDGLVFRVQMAPDPVPIEIWNSLKLEWKYIVMG